jgi:hypothetical protein
MNAMMRGWWEHNGNDPMLASNGPTTSTGKKE